MLTNPNSQVENYLFNDPELDNLRPFNYYARSFLIERMITKEDYLVIESLTKQAASIKQKLSPTAAHVLKIILSDL